MTWGEIPIDYLCDSPVWQMLLHHPPQDSLAAGQLAPLGDLPARGALSRDAGEGLPGWGAMRTQGFLSQECRTRRPGLGFPRRGDTGRATAGSGPFKRPSRSVRRAAATAPRPSPSCGAECGPGASAAGVGWPSAARGVGGGRARAREPEESSAPAAAMS